MQLEEKTQSYSPLKGLKASLADNRVTVNGESITVKQLFQDFKNITEELFGMTESVNSDYYEEEFNKRRNEFKIQKSNEIFNDFENFLTQREIIEQPDGTYTINKKMPNGQIMSTQIAQDKEQLIRDFSEAQTLTDFPNTQWFKDNHFIDYTIENGTVTEVISPLHFWREVRPTNPDYIKHGPTFQFLKFEIKPEMNNPNFKLVAPGLGTVKKSSKYYKETKLEKPYQDLLNELREFYYDSQENSSMLSEERMFDILPAIIKTSNENAVNFTKSLSNGGLIKSVTDWWKEAFAKNDDDNQILRAGSVNKKFVRDKLIPYRFNNKMDASDQSSDLFTSLLVYDNVNTDVFNKRVLEKVFEAAETATQDLTRKTETFVAGALNVKNLLKFWKNKGQATKVTEEKEGRSVLNTTIQHMMDTFVYGEYRNDATFNIGGFKMDGHKVADNLKRVSNAMIFNLKVFTPLKNQISSTIFSFIYSNMGAGFYSNRDYAKALVEAPLLIKDLIMDYRKIAHKSHIGSSLDFFQVFQGYGLDEYGKKIQFSALAQSYKSLAFIKHAAELQGQVATFLAISNANRADLNGKSVPFYEAFEMKNGVYSPKKGATINGKAITEEDITRVRRAITYINRRINGATRRLDKAKYQKGVFGSLASYLNNFVMPGITARFGKTEFHGELGDTVRGYYIEFFNFAGEIFRYGNGINSTWKTLSPEQKTRVWMFIQELSAAISLTILISLLTLGGDDKDSLRTNSPMHNYLLALAMGVGAEVQTFIPVPSLGWDELIRKINNPFAAASQAKAIGKMINNATQLINPFGNEDAFFQTQGIRDGFHDIGDPKVVADFIKLTGFNFNEFSSVDKVVQVKQSQILR